MKRGFNRRARREREFYTKETKGTKDGLGWTRLHWKLRRGEQGWTNEWNGDLTGGHGGSGEGKTTEREFYTKGTKETKNCRSVGGMDSMDEW